MSATVSFFDELIRVSEIDCKSTEKLRNKEGYCGMDIITEQALNDWSNNEKGMISKIIELCGFQFENCAVIDSNTLSEVYSSIQSSDTNYVLVFGQYTHLKSLHFQPKSGWTIINNTKLFFCPNVSDLQTNAEEKKRLWKAIQIEFQPSIQ